MNFFNIKNIQVHYVIQPRAHYYQFHHHLHVHRLSLQTFQIDFEYHPARLASLLEGLLLLKCDLKLYDSVFHCFD